MSFIAYETSYKYSPDPDFVNIYPMEYIAWRLSTNKQAGTALWVIEQVVSNPTLSLSEILPESYRTLTINNDLKAYGYQRHTDPNLSIQKFEESLTDTTEGVTNSLL